VLVVTPERKSLLGVLLFVIIIQSFLGLFDPVEARQTHGEHVGHTKARISNIFDDFQTDCSTSFDELSDGVAFPEHQGCWHYRSYSVIYEFIYALSFILGGGYVGIKIFSLLISMFELVLLFTLMNRHFGARSASISTLIYATLPMYLYYAQTAIPPHIDAIVILLAALYSLPVLLGEDMNRKQRIIGWLVLIIGPFTGTLMAFAWAGFALFVLLHPTRRNKSGILVSSCLVLLPVIAFFMQLSLNEALGSSASAHLGRFSSRSSLSSFLDSSFLIMFADDLANAIGPIGIVVAIVAVIRRHSIFSLPSEVQLALFGLGSMVFWTLFFFQITFVECCTYFAYPLAPMIAILSTKTLDIAKQSKEGIISALLVLSLIGGLQLHEVPNNYFERPMQQYVIEHITDEDATVVLSQDLVQYNAFRFQLPNGSINFDPSESPEILRVIIDHRTPDHIILSASAFESGNVSVVLNESGYCVTELESDPHIPDHWITGWMSDILPIHVAVRCDDS